MANGTFAVLMLIGGLTDMGMNYCGTAEGCLGPNETQPRVAFSLGSVVERQAEAKGEAYLRYDFGRKFGPFGQAIGVSMTEDGEGWLGYGATYKKNFGYSPFYAELHLMPGIYMDNGGFDLGGPLEFRSGIELGYEFNQGWRVGLSYDHRSNADIYDNNPGIETVQLRVSIPTR
ncbi:MULTISPECIES: acyloxyacyl hydrolase [Roseobacteraceae]|uniref:acyloxyacyl hydrolase n=1 Tax=Roseobacteraceae TaxID=2854170 RepID=UPI0013BB92E6|nr:MULTISPECIES: acyloxyacyl hydrolase [unclassified Salipiger]NDV49097.1 acyloxyacyl hydrolase [Salipiger sp. PrR003]NDW31356.1 acyloxyacyl hydrolase [Salipiger sp. PrR007]